MLTASILLAALTMVSEPACAGEPVLARQVLITDEVYGPRIEPHAITRAGDGGFVIAGTLLPTRGPWAVRADAEGNALWHYHPDYRDEVPLFGGRPEFKAVVEMPDGSIYLCGHMPGPPEQYNRALLVHLDAAGHVLTEKRVRPRDASWAPKGAAYLEKAVRVGNGVVFVGHVTRVIPSESAPAGWAVTEFYWLVALDAAGNVAWEKLFSPALDNGVIDTIGPALAAADDSIAFTGTRFPQTELMRVGKDGKLEAGKTLPEQYVFTQSIVAPTSLKIFGGIPARIGGVPQKNGGTKSLITLDAQFNEVDRIDGSHPEQYELREGAIFRMSDQSLVMFGTGLKTRAGGLASEVRVVSPTLQAERVLGLAKPPFSDGGFVPAAMPTGRPGEFAAIRQQWERLSQSEVRLLGVALDFIQVK